MIEEPFEDLKIRQAELMKQWETNSTGKMIKYVCEKHSLTFVIAETDKDAVDFYLSYGFINYKLSNLNQISFCKTVLPQ